MINLLLGCAHGYYEFNLERTQLPSLAGLARCSDLAKLEGQGGCRLQDISYNTRFRYFENESRELLVGFDFNLPQTWIKHDSCQEYDLATNATNSCHFLTTAETKRAKGKKAPEQNLSEGLLDYGQVRGEYEGAKTLHIKVRNSNKFASIMNIIRAGLFLEDENDDIILQRTQFIDAYSVPGPLSRLTDGKLSLYHGRKSFADEFLHEDSKTIAIWLDSEKKKGVLTLGNIPYKFVQGGISSVYQVPFVPENNSFAIHTLNVRKADDEQAILGQQLYGQICLGCSYIGLPASLIKVLIEELGGECSAGNLGFLECKKKGKKTPIFGLQILLKKGELKLSYQDLVLEEAKGRVRLRVAEVEGESVLLGEPVLDKYMLALDYMNRQLVFGPSRKVFSSRIFETLTFIRVVIMMFVLGFTVIWCYAPFREAYKSSRMYLRMRQFRNSIESKYLRYEVVQDQDLNLDELKDQVSEFRRSREAL